jgi:hypothetical protein
MSPGERDQKFIEAIVQINVGFVGGVRHGVSKSIKSL